ncbi:helix-turn-helix domain-containing protein [Nocardia sp. NPDC127606]|uniref:helix-turn-helix domain-containing protein n=1 Tax=Nocardia sp. NPDC127606 TaxID=3345406 RepID=UPI003639765F
MPNRSPERANRQSSGFAKPHLPDLRTVEQLSRTFGCARYVYNRALLAEHSKPLDIRWSRPLPDSSVPTQVTVSRDSAGRYHISILVEETIADHVRTDTAIGSDAGTTSLYTFSTSEKVSNPRHEKHDRAAWSKPNECCRRNRKAQRIGQRHVFRSRYSYSDHGSSPRPSTRALNSVGSRKSSDRHRASECSEHD